MMQMFSLVNLKICIAVLATLQLCYGSPLSDHLKMRQEIKSEENELSFGNKIELTDEELRVNEYLMAAKYQEIDAGFKNPSTFLPAKNFIAVRDEISKSLVHEMIRKMPKGGVLHVHESCLTSMDFVIGNLTHLPNLYLCLDDNKLQFKFFEKPTKDCNWTLMEDLRERNIVNDAILKQNITSFMDEMKNETDQNAVWILLRGMFDTVKGIMFYRPAFEAYLYRGLQELYYDNVMYAELRWRFEGLYELDGPIQDPVECFKVCKKVVDKFRRDYPKFLDVKIIFAISRTSSHERFDSYVKIFRTVKSAYPDLIVGFDVVGQEDLGQPMLNFIEKLLELGNETNFYFHAGETKWFGQTSDENLIDAVLLKSRRIGHGVALLKHPKILEIVKNSSIAVEINPISNQVLKYVGDMQNHPASYYFANGFPVVVSNDNPSAWGARGLSDDFYETFVGIMSRKADLRALKQLAINSIIYSSMTEDERTEALKKWGTAWNEYIQNFLSSRLLSPQKFSPETRFN